MSVSSSRRGINSCWNMIRRPSAVRDRTGVSCPSVGLASKLSWSGMPSVVIPGFSLTAIQRLDRPSSGVVRPRSFSHPRHQHHRHRQRSHCPGDRRCAACWSGQRSMGLLSRYPDRPRPKLRSFPGAQHRERHSLQRQEHPRHGYKYSPPIRKSASGRHGKPVWATNRPGTRAPVLGNRRVERPRQTK